MINRNGFQTKIKKPEKSEMLTIVKRSFGRSKKVSLNFPSTGKGASTRFTT